MADFICKRCKKDFIYKSSYDRHVNRKNKCKISDDPVPTIKELQKAYQDQKTAIDKLSEILTTCQNKNTINKKERDKYRKLTFKLGSILNYIGMSMDDFDKLDANFPSLEFESIVIKFRNYIKSKGFLQRILETPIDGIVRLLFKNFYFSTKNPDNLIFILNKKQSHIFELKRSRSDNNSFHYHDIKLTYSDKVDAILQMYYISIIEKIETQIQEICDTSSSIGAKRNCELLIDMKTSNLKESCLMAIKRMISENRDEVINFWKCLNIKIPDSFENENNQVSD